jgi:hypothetical protein
LWWIKEGRRLWVGVGGEGRGGGVGGERGHGAAAWATHP